jgi:hypothetical protein
MASFSFCSRYFKFICYLRKKKEESIQSLFCKYFLLFFSSLFSSFFFSGVLLISFFYFSSFWKNEMIRKTKRKMKKKEKKRIQSIFFYWLERILIRFFHLVQKKLISKRCFFSFEFFFLFSSKKTWVQFQKKEKKFQKLKKQGRFSFFYFNMIRYWFKMKVLEKTLNTTQIFRNFFLCIRIGKFLFIFFHIQKIYYFWNSKNNIQKIKKFFYGS